MDITSLLEQALLLEAISLLPTFILLKLSRKRIERFIMGIIGRYVDKMLKYFQENPEQLAAIFRPAIALLIRDMSKSAEGAQIKLPIIGKVPAELAMGILGRFVGKGTEKAADAVFG